MNDFAQFQFIGNQKALKGKQNDTQSESQDRQNQHQDDLITESKKNFTSVNKILTYLQFFLPSQNSQPLNNNLTQQTSSIKNNVQKVLKLINQNSQQHEQKGHFNETILDFKKINILANLQREFKQRIQKDILFSKRFKKSDKFTQQIVINEIRPSKSYESLKIQLHLMCYKTQIFILNEIQNSPLIKFSPIAGSGAFGNVYFSKLINDSVALKSIQIQNLGEWQQDNTSDNSKFKKISIILTKALKQFFFVLLFSELKIGPQVKTIGGFDIVIYQDSIAFATEICSQFQYKENSVDIKQSLFKMNMLQIVHRDIKPSNIMFSQTYKKNVFIDFGCTEILNAKIGEKSFTCFLGTTAFCTQEVLFLLTDNKKAVDLYFNDMFGLDKSLTNLRLSKNTISHSTQEFQQIWQLQLNSLKYSLYVQNYEKFILEWKIMRKKYPLYFEQISKRIIFYLKDLKPNQTLRKFYWEQIDSDIKCLPQYKDLDIVLKNENSKLLYYLDMDPSKIEAFRIRKKLFKTLQISFSELKPQEKQIDLCLMNKDSLKASISGLFTKLQNISNCQQKNFSQKDEQDFEKLCHFVSQYSSLISNKYDTSIQQKVKACEKVLQIKKKIEDSFLHKIDIIFKCPIQIFEPINIFYQYFFMRILPNIPQKYRTRAMIQSVSNLSFLGYPLYDYFYSIQFLENHLITFGQSGQDLLMIQDEKRIQKIVMLWECKNTMLLFNHIFYDRNITMSLIKLTEQVEEEFIRNKEYLMKPKDQQKSLFFHFNYKFYKSIASNVRNLSQSKLKDLADILEMPELQQMCAENKLIKKWKRLVCFSLAYVTQAHKFKNTITVLKVLQKSQIFQCQDNQIILPFLIFFYWDQIVISHIESHHIFKKIDQIIGYKDLSLKFQLQTRFKIAIERKDLQNMRQIIDFIIKQIKFAQISKQNIKFVQNILGYIYDFFNQYLKSLPNLNEQLFELLYVCHPIVSLLMQIGINFLQNQRNKQLRQFVLSRQNNNTDVTLVQIENQIRERQLIKTLALQLILIADLYDNINSHIKIQTQQQNQIIQNKHILKKIDEEKFVLSQNFKSSLKKLRNQKNIFDYSDFWIQMLQKNQNLRQQVKRFRRIAIQFAVLFMKDRKNKDEIIKGHKIIGRIFDQIRVDRFNQSFEDLNLPPFNILYEYILIELVQTNYDLYWCNQMIKLYQISWQKNLLRELIFRQKSVRYIFNCLVYTQASFKEIKIFLSRFSLVLKQYPNKFCIRNFNKTLKSLFWCNCTNCFTRKPEKWNEHKFANYLSLTVKQEKEVQNPYMSMVYYYNMPNKYLSDDTSRRFIMSILRSIPYLAIEARQIIKQGLNFFIFSLFFRDRRQKNDFLQYNPNQSVQKQFINKLKSSPKLYMEKNIQSFFTNLTLIDPNQSYKYKMGYRKITKQQMKKPINRKLLYHYGLFKKHQQYSFDSLQSLLKKRFFKQQLVEGYYYPKFVKKAYMKKIRRYHELKQNYKQTEKLAELSKLTRYREVVL